MLDDTKVYRLSIYIRVMMFLGIIIFGFASVASLMAGERFLSISCFLPFCLLGVFTFISSLYKVELKDVEISVTNYLRTKTLRWDEIAYMIPKNDGFGFYLSNQTADTRIFISNQAVGFLELVEWIKSKRPDLWMSQIPASFHQVVTGTLILAIFGIGMTVFSVISLLAGTEDYLSAVFLLVIGVFVIILLFNIPREISFEDKNLVVRYLGRARVVHPDDVSGISIEQRQSQHIMIYPVQVELKNGKKLIFGNVREGSQALVSVLEQWLKKYKTH